MKNKEAMWLLIGINGAWSRDDKKSGCSDPNLLLPSVSRTELDKYPGKWLVSRLSMKSVTLHCWEVTWQALTSTHSLKSYFANMFAWTSGPVGSGGSRHPLQNGAVVHGRPRTWRSGDSREPSLSRSHGSSPKVVQCEVPSTTCLSVRPQMQTASLAAAA